MTAVSQLICKQEGGIDRGDNKNKNMKTFFDGTYYIPVNTTLFPAGTICCLGCHVSACVPSSGLVFKLFYHVLSINLPCKQCGSTSALYIICTTYYITYYNGLVFYLLVNTVVILLKF
jgi:hypothetical protein